MYFIAMHKQNTVFFVWYVVHKHCSGDQNTQFKKNQPTVIQGTVKIWIFSLSIILLNNILKKIYSNFCILFTES